MGLLRNVLGGPRNVFYKGWDFFKGPMAKLERTGSIFLWQEDRFLLVLRKFELRTLGEDRVWTLRVVKRE